MKLITGGSGFIGSNLNADVKLYSGAKREVDLRNYNDTLAYLDKHKPITVIHTAAKHGNFKEMGMYDTSFIQSNARIDLNIIEACKEVGVKNLLMMSSITSFPEGTPLPYNESNFFNGDVSRGQYGYSFSKKLSVSLCTAYQKEFGLNYKSVLLGNVYGPNNSFNSNSTVVANLIYNCYQAKINNTDFNIYGDGSPVRDFIYVDDLNDIFDKIIASSDMEPSIVSSGKLVNIRGLVEMIVENLDFKGNVVWGNETNMGQIEKYSDISKLRSIIGDYEFTSIEEGVAKTCKWYYDMQTYPKGM